jgi:fatty-acyl-CoA synthase
MTRTESTADTDIKPARFAVNERVKVLDEHTGREVTPGSDEVGMVAVTGRIPLGYYKDETKTATTFRTVDGVRYSIPGDYATVDADGTIQLLGRGSACINTGGEKVYPEEVELVLRQHPDVFDCVIVGVPDERFGEMVVGLVQPADGAALDEHELDEWCRTRMSGYKRPKRWRVLDSLERNAAGKANYKHLRALAQERVKT